MKRSRAVLWVFAVVAGLSGGPARPETLSIVGSESMAALVTKWAEAYQAVSPSITFEIQGTGSASAPPALAEGTANIGAMSRPMSDLERSAFRRRAGYEPLGLTVAEDALTIIVNPANPLIAVSLIALDAIFSVTRRCGGPENYSGWGSLMASGDAKWRGILRDIPILRLSRTAVSGSYGFFKRVALCDGDFQPSVVELPGFVPMVNSVADSPGAIAYVGSGFVTPLVKPIGILIGDTVLYPRDEAYPLSRRLYLYLSAAPGQAASPTECGFLKFIDSAQGLAILHEAGFRPATQGLHPGINDVCGKP